MAKFKKREFYEHCGVAKSYFYQYVKRGKIHVSADGLIDTDMPMNRDFMDSRIRNKKSKAPEVEKVVQVVSIPETKPRKNTKQELAELAKRMKREDAADEAATRKYDLDRQIKEAELEAKEQQIELNRLKIAKLSGEVIPTSLVRVIFAQHFKSVTTAMHQGCDNFIMTISKVTGMKKKDMARMRGELIDIVNEAVRDGIDESKESVKNIVSEYSEKRGVGEKK